MGKNLKKHIHLFQSIQSLVGEGGLGGSDIARTLAHRVVQEHLSLGITVAERLPPFPNSAMSNSQVQNQAEHQHLALFSTRIGKKGNWFN